MHHISFNCYCIFMERKQIRDRMILIVVTRSYTRKEKNDNLGTNIIVLYIQFISFFFNCNDEGIPHLEAQVKCTLRDFLNNPIPDELSEFISLELGDVRC